MRGCGKCYNFDDCTPLIKQLLNENFTWEYFIDCNNDCLMDGSDKWREFSYNKYTDNLLDYGEMSDWDIFILEEEFEF